MARVLTNDPMMGVFRHADAGYEEAMDAQTNKASGSPCIPTPSLKMNVQ